MLFTLNLLFVFIFLFSFTVLAHTQTKKTTTKTEIRMTASILKQDPNAKKVKKNVIYYDKNNLTKQLNQRQVSILHLIFTV